MTPQLLIFDVGANVGDKTMALRELGSRVICFEPQARMADALRRRFARDPRVEVVQSALGRAVATQTLFVCSAAPTISTLSAEWKTGRFKDQDFDDTEVVDVSTLDAMIAAFGEPNYIKVDVEGFERDVISGLSQPVDLLSFEFTTEFFGNATACVDRLASIGMTRFNIRFGECPEFRSATWLDAAQINMTLEHLDHELAWGDVFAARTTAMTEAAESFLLDETPQGRTDGLYRRLLRRGLWFPGTELHLAIQPDPSPDPKRIRVWRETGDENLAAEDLSALELAPETLRSVDLSLPAVYRGPSSEHALLLRVVAALKIGGSLRLSIRPPPALYRANGVQELSELLEALAPSVACRIVSAQDHVGVISATKLAPIGPEQRASFGSGSTRTKPDRGP